MARKKNFFPSERRKRRAWVAIGERQMAGEPWKYPWESWGEQRCRAIAKLAEAGSRAIRDRLREQSITRRIMTPAQISQQVAVDKAVEMHAAYPLQQQRDQASIDKWMRAFFAKGRR